MIFTGSKEAAALFVEDILAISNLGWRAITIINLEPSEGCYVSVATDLLSEDTVKEVATTYSLELTNISMLTTQAG